MYTVLQYLIFFILTVMGLSYLFNNKIFLLKDPFNKNTLFVVNNQQYLFLFLLATAILGCGVMMANRLLICIIVTLIGIFLSKEKIKITPAIFFYFIYLCWLIVEMYLSPVKGYGLRVFLKYLYPFIIMLFASKMPMEKNPNMYFLKVLNVVLYVGLLGSIWQLLLFQIPFVSQVLDSVVYWGPAIVDFYVVPITISLFLFSYTGKYKYLFYVVLFILPSVLGSIRTGILASSITIVIFAILRYKVRSIPYVVLGCALLVGTVLFVPQVREKMFIKQMSADEIVERGESLSKDDIDSSGRFAMWEWSLKNFYEEKELMGSGLGMLQHAFYDWDHPFGIIKIVHNDYIQILCDTGIIGLVLYALTLLALIIHSIFVYFTDKNAIAKLMGGIAGVSLAGMLSTLYTDNVVNYSLMTLSFPFALYGLMLGFKRYYSDDI
ncbi:O-antigen ligase [Dysgonomonadaceae bacterium PH5-43]|nr:O-antigen ligase [Dysgonomonadaceae bacterium PH5-43]